MTKSPMLGSLLTLALLLCAGALPSQSTPASTGCSLQQVDLQTSAGVRLEGLLYGATKPRAAALVLVHGYGSNFYSGYFPELGRAAVAAGYVTLAVNMRDHDQGPKTSDFTDNQADIAAAANYLHKLGHRKLVLLGQSMGANRVLYYQAASGDPDIAATVLVASPGNLFEWNVWQLGREKAQASVDQALAMQGSREQEFLTVDLGPMGKALYSPRYLLSMRGPKARSDPYENVQKVHNPVLIVQGKADRLVPPDVPARLQKAAPAVTKAQLVYIEGAGHQFEQHEDELVRRVVDWIKQTVP
jgi:pimeloyl-ACP methyl ester carboxylesterase